MIILLLASALLVPVSPASVDLIVRHEVGSKARYDARYQRPVWPGLQSGPTIGIGSDLGMQSVPSIRKTWVRHSQVDRLTVAAGVTGQAAKALTATMQDVVTPWDVALTAFECTDLVRYWRIAHRTFGDGFLALSGDAQGALTSVVYNRGGSTVGPARREYRAIRDQCIPARDEQCIAVQIMAMKRLWNPQTMRGLHLRRDAEAALIGV